MTDPHESFVFEAASAEGRIRAGVVRASSRDAASALLTDRGLLPLRLARQTDSLGRASGVSTGDLAEGFHTLATLLESGLPLTECLHVLESLVPASWSSLLPPLQAAVRRGSPLSEALRSSPTPVPPLVIGLLRAGEASGGLGPAVRRAADWLERATERARAVRSALAYPAILSAAGAASLGLLVGIVIPRFATILTDLGEGLPPVTRAVLGLAELIRLTALPALAAAAVLILVGRNWSSGGEGRVQWHHVLQRVPLLGPVRGSLSAARGCEALGSLLAHGVSLVRALPLAAEAGGDAWDAKRLAAARERVLRGESLSRALDREEAWTPGVRRLAAAGEHSGQLAPMLSHAGRMEGEAAERKVRAAVRLIEPALIIGFGAVVAVVAAALLQAVYTVRPGL